MKNIDYSFPSTYMQRERQRLHGERIAKATYFAKIAIGGTLFFCAIYVVSMMILVVSTY
jgi:hypothetical protein